VGVPSPLPSPFLFLDVAGDAVALAAPVSLSVPCHRYIQSATSRTSLAGGRDRLKCLSSLEPSSKLLGLGHHNAKSVLETACRASAVERRHHLLLLLTERSDAASCKYRGDYICTDHLGGVVVVGSDFGHDETLIVD
jgi:hypothetical protein